MARGEGSGWHHENRRHSEAASKGKQRTTHAPRSGKPFQGRDKLEKLTPDTPMDEETYQALLEAVNDRENPMRAYEWRDKINNYEPGWALGQKTQAWLKRRLKEPESKALMSGRENGVMKNLATIKLDGFYPAPYSPSDGPYHELMRYPVFSAYGKDGEGFQFAWRGGKFELTG